MVQRLVKDVKDELIMSLPVKSWESLPLQPNVG